MPMTAGEQWDVWSECGVNLHPKTANVIQITRNAASHKEVTTERGSVFFVFAHVGALGRAIPVA